MREKSRYLIGMAVILYAMAFFALEAVHDAVASGLNKQAENIELTREISPPFDGGVKYPFTKNDSEKCGHWRSGSQDYPYFGAPRDGNTRSHAGIDLYPTKGAGTPIKAIRDGKVIRIAPFYKRRNGEITYALLIDHKEFVANYAELRKPTLVAGAIVKQKQTIGFVSGTEQLHFELYKPGTGGWLPWHGKMPPNLIDPTDMMTRVFGKMTTNKSPSKNFNCLRGAKGMRTL
jgi:murein DD-endopeptidase MepM/ murein hydrolase activator NlpD